MQIVHRDYFEPRATLIQIYLQHFNNDKEIVDSISNYLRYVLEIHYMVHLIQTIYSQFVHTLTQISLTADRYVLQLLTSQHMKTFLSSFSTSKIEKRIRPDHSNPISFSLVDKKKNNIQVKKFARGQFGSWTPYIVTKPLKNSNYKQEKFYQKL